MVIKEVTVRRSANGVTLSARCKIRKLGWDTIYFSVQGTNYQEYLYEDASPFAAALLLPSMKVGEDLIIHGSISEQLLAGLETIMHEVSGWGIGLRPIRILPDRVAPDASKPTHTGSFFSGGVDSFYTLLKHKTDEIKSHRIDSIIFVNNSFDIDERNKKLWGQTLDNIQAIADDEHIDLVVVKSNINSHELLAPILTWDYIHGACLAATGLALRKAFRRIYIASTHSVDEQMHWGSNLSLDNHWSSENLTFVHDGSEVTRLDKVILQVSKSPTALKHLRVCYKNVDGAYNCGKCDKCLRTMVNLYIAGALEKSKTFPNQLDIERIASTPTVTPPFFHTENLMALKERKLNPALQKAIATSIQSTRVLKEEGQLQKYAKKLIFLDHSYTHGRLYALSSSVLGRKFS